MKKQSEDEQIAAGQIVLSTLHKQTEIVKSELFATEHVSYEVGNDLSVTEAFLALIALNADCRGERGTCSLIENYRRWAELTIQAADNPSQRKKHADKDAWWEELREHARDVLHRITNLENEIRQNNFHDAILAGMQLQSAVMKKDLFFKQAEPNARRGRLHSAGSRKGSDETNRLRTADTTALSNKIQADYKTLLDENQPRQITALLAEKHNLHPSTIRRHLKKSRTR